MLQTHQPPGLILPPSLIYPKKQAIMPVHHGIIASGQKIAEEGGGPGDGSLQDEVASCVFDIDATIAACYPGTGQTLANLVTAPADGEDQADYDFYLGDSSSATTDDPTFTGSADDPAAYFLLDGSDMFSLASGTNPAWIRDWQKTTAGTNFTIVTAMMVQTHNLTQHIFSTMSSGTGVGVRGIINTASNGLNKGIVQRGGSGNAVGTATDLTSADNDIVLLVFSYSHAGTLRVWQNGFLQEISLTFNNTTTDASAKLRFGVLATASNFLVNTTRIYGFSGFNEYFDNTKEAAIRAAYEARHERDYTA